MPSTAIEQLADVNPQAIGPEELPFVSIIIPVKNDARRLQVCLHSLDQQDYPRERFEVIVVDNGSGDNSAEVARQLGAKVLEHPGLNVGALRNRGLEASRGDVIAFIDSDHEAPRTWLSNAVNSLAADERLAIVGAHYLSPSGGTWVQRYWATHRLRRWTRHEADWLGAGNMFIRRSELERAGGFREELVAAEDVDLCLRVASAGGSILHDPAVGNIHYGEPRTVGHFFRKEYWRGSSGVRAFIQQGCPLRELPSLLFPLYYLVAGLYAAVSLALLVWHRSAVHIFAALLAVLLPSLFLAAKTCFQAKEIRPFAPLVVLYVTYGFARAAALFKK